MAEATEIEAIALPPPRRSGPCGLESIMWRRRTLREFAPAPLSLADLGQLLWAGGGLAEEEGKRIVPSAGALYPLRFFAVVRQVAGLPAGLYGYDPAGHGLSLLQSGDLSGRDRDRGDRAAALVGEGAGRSDHRRSAGPHG